MATNTSLVTQITGQAWIRGADGALTPLQAGMSIPANADVVTSTGAQVQLQADGQPPLIIGENRDVQLGADVAQPDVDPATSAAAAPAGPDAAGILAALQNGADPFAELDPTAAVIQGGGPGDGGSSFTRIAAVLELTTPLGLEYPRPTYPRTEEVRLGGVGSNRAPELTGSALTAAGLLDQINDDSDIIAGLNVGQYFTDPDGQDLTFTATGLPPGLTINPITGVIEGKLDSSASQGGPGGDGIYNVVITGTDPYGAKVDLPFTWTTHNPPPVAHPDQATTDENVVVEGNVLTGDKDGNGTDVDPDGDKLTVTEITSGDKTVSAGTPIAGVNPDPGKGGGTLTINPDGSYTFEPGDDFDYLAVGEETNIEVTYQITDGDGGYSETTLTITVTGSNDAPVIQIDKPENAAVTVIEIEDGEPGENTTTHTKSGEFSFTDDDDSDTHTVTSTPAGNDYLGDFSFTVGADNKIKWTFEVEDSAIDHLADGQKLKQEYVITIDDGKGGTVEQKVTVIIDGNNDAPVITSVAGEHAGSVTEDADVNTATGRLTHTDDDNTDHDSQSWSLVTKDADGNATLSSTIDGIYGYLTLDATTGKWTYLLDNTRAATNALKEGEEVKETFTARVTDKPGAFDEQDIVITVKGNSDGEPSIVPKDENAGGDINGHITVHEKGLVEDGGSHIASGSIKVTAGDGLASITIGDTVFTVEDLLALSADNPSGAIDVGHGTIVLNGFTEDASVGGVPTEGTLSYTYQLGVKQDHSNPDNDESLNLTVDLGVTSVDSPAGPGETKGGTLIIEVKDDTPTVDVDAGKLPPVVVDETQLGVSAEADFSDVFTHQAGADGEESVEYGLELDETIDSGLVDTLTGEKVELSQNANGDIVGKNMAGDTVLTISIDADGKVTLTQERAVTHSDQKDHDDSISLNSGAVKVTLTVTDGDDDATTGSVDAGGSFIFKDDGPSIKAPESGTVNEANLSTGSEGVEIANTTITGILGVNFGADGGADTYFTEATLAKLEALDLTSDGKELVYMLGADGHTLTATADGKAIFTITLTDTKGQPGYKFELQGAIDHREDTSGAAIDQVLELPFEVKDGDGDRADGSFNITVKDDAGHGENHTISVDEDKDITFNTSADGTDNSVQVGTGDDGPKHGKVTVDENGRVTYEPDRDYSGPDRFTYTTTENGVTTTTVVEVTVNPVADMPDFEAGGKVVTDEDQAIALGLKAPTVTDATDQSGIEDDHDNPERLGEITLSGFPAGAKLLVTDADGKVVQIIEPDADGNVTISLTGPNAPEHISGVGGVELTVDQFEGLQVLPPAEGNKNFTITGSVTSYEVNKNGVKLTGVNGAETEITVDVVVEAVTDPILLELKGDDAINGVEDEPINLKNYLEVSFPENYEDGRVGDGNSGPDIDGSEERWFEIAGLPVGTVIDSGGKSYTAEGGVIKVPAPGLSTSANALPDLIVNLPKDYSGTITGVKVTLVATDRDADGNGEDGAREVSSVDVNLHITPEGGDVSAPDVTTKEDISIAFMAGLKVTDDNLDVPAGSGLGEKITAITVKGIPAGWVLNGPDGEVALIPSADADGTFEYTLPIDVVQAEGWGDYTLTPPAHSSTDADITLKVTTVDTNKVNGNVISSEVTKDLDIVVKVTPVAEQIDTDLTGKEDDRDFKAIGEVGDDLTMTEGNDYSAVVAGQEDGWFDLNVPEFDLSDRWSNVDGRPAEGDVNNASEDGGTEETFALLTPILVDGIEGETAAGAKFQYKDDKGKLITLEFNGKDAIEVPVWALDSLQFMAPEHVSGKFDIRIQAKTKDYDADGDGGEHGAVSGQSWLTNIVVKPEADGVDSLRVNPASGKEDTAINLFIAPSSVDPSETFNIEISDIPEGSTLTYGGSELNIAWSTDNGKTTGTVTINDFDSDTKLTITPPENSNEDIKLNVKAQTVDSVKVGDTTHTDTSDWSDEKPLHVNVKGVADEATITPKSATFKEGDLDGHEGAGTGTTIALSDLVCSVVMDDGTDGSETLSFKLTGFPDGFEISGPGVIFMGGAGEGREWVFAVGKDQNVDGVLKDITIKTPEHYSGKLPGSITAITTENDGDAWVGKPVKWDAVITPTPESVLTGSSTINEDSLDQIMFGIADNKGDTNEELTAVFIKASDVDGNENFTLYLGKGEDRVTLKEALGQGKVELDGEYYKITGHNIENIYAQAKDNFANNTADAPDLGFGVKYEITDYEGIEDPNEDSIFDYFTTEEVRHDIQVTPVTDPVDLTLKDVAITDRSDFNVSFTVAQKPDANVEGEASPDRDGSEQFTQVIVDGVPEGMLLTGITLTGITLGTDTTIGGAVFLGNGKWLISIPASDAATFDDADISGTLNFKAGDLLASGEHKITVTVVTKDTGASKSESDTETVTVDATSIGGSNGPDVRVVTVEFAQNASFTGIEDESFTLDQAFTAKIDQDDVNFSLVLKLPADTKVTSTEGGLSYTRVGEEDVWIITGKGNQADLDALLKGIEITPPDHRNDNKGGLEIDATLTTYLDNGSQEQVNVDGAVSLLPITDGAVVDIAFSAADPDGKPTEDKPQEGSDLAIRLTVRDGVDSDSEFGDSVYLQVTEANGLLGGTLVDSNGEPLEKMEEDVRIDLGLDPGDYYVAKLPEGQTSVDVRYVPANGQEYTAGDVTINAWVQSKEKGALDTDWKTAKSSNTAELHAVNNGYDLTVGKHDEITGKWSVPGDENSDGKPGSAIKLDIGGDGLLDKDGSEQVVAVQLGNVPEGFLVYVNGEELASNGGDGNWLISVGAGGKLPKISILPPKHWSGTLDDLELSVLSGEQDGQPSWGPKFDFELTVKPVANGILSFDPAAAFSDKDGVVHLNLNIALVDRVDASVKGAPDASNETVSLNLAGIGEHALFLLNGKVYDDVTYDATSKSYTVTGLTPEEVNSLSFVQTGDKTDSKITVEAWTVDGESESSRTEGKEFTLHMQDGQPATGTDGPDIIVGSESSETLNGGKGDDIVYGGKGNDTLIGGEGDDILIGGAGDDIFKWEAGDQGDFDDPAKDIIKDFGLGGDDPNGADILDLSELLTGLTQDEDGEWLGLDKYLSFSEDSDNNMVIQIDTTGTGSGFNQQITLEGVRLDDFASSAENAQNDMIKSLIEQSKPDLGY